MGSKPDFYLAIFFSREKAKSERDWLVMSSVFVDSQSGCFFICPREQIRVQCWKIAFIQSHTC
jgi:hypothetical protein